MKRAVLFLSVTFLAAIAAFAGDTVVEEIVARVNNQIITRSELQRARETTIEDARKQFGTEAEKKLPDIEKNVLRDLIDAQLLIQKGQDLGISVDTDLVKYLDQIRKEQKLETMEDLEKLAQQSGVSFEDFKQKIKNDITTQKVIGSEIISHIQITKEEIQDYYDKHKKELDRPEAVRLSEILVSTQTKSESKDAAATAAAQPTPEVLAAAEAKAKDVLASLKKGAKFEEVAKKSSDGPSAKEGGDLEYFERGKLAKQLEDTVFAMKAGEISGVIQTKQGFVILKVTEHIPAGIPPLKDVEEYVQGTVQRQKMQPALRAYLTKLREEAFIDIKPGFVDTGASPNQTKPVITTAPTEAEKKEAKKKKKLLLF